MLDDSFRKPSHSVGDGNCLEAAFRKSSHSESGNCAEAAVRDGAVLVRDSKQEPQPGCEGPGSPVLAFTPGAWEAFLTTVRKS